MYMQIYHTYIFLHIPTGKKNNANLGFLAVKVMSAE